VLRDLGEQRALGHDASSTKVTTALLAAALLVGLTSIWLIARHVTWPLVDLTALMTRLSGGDADIQLPYLDRGDEVGKLSRALQVFKDLKAQAASREWVKTQSGRVSGRLQRATEKRQFAENLLSEVTPLVGSVLASFYQLPENSDSLRLLAGYGLNSQASLKERYRIGEGLVGQCAQERKPLVVTDLPENYLQVHSSLGEAASRTLLLLPILQQERLLGVLELASFTPLSELHKNFLDEMLPIIALSFENLVRAIRTQELLEESQTQTEELRAADEELRAQQEELRMSNEQLEEQARRLRASEEELRVQTEELQVSNEELQQRSEVLRQQKRQMEQLQIETAHKAKLLEDSNRYKSEFLANMSHELRTPLNSILLLSGSLANDRSGSLSAEHQEVASIINDSGQNLLRLINDILDLSKVEAGKMDVLIEDLDLSSLAESFERSFRHVAQKAGVEFRIELAPELPRTIRQDIGKVGQIVSNLLANAFKFTERGRVVLRFDRPDARTAGALVPTQSIAISVTDTGIGIPVSHQQQIFSAFEQVDGSSSRKYAGTGLGLTISRSLARLLGGDVRVQSVENSGSVFTLVLPDRLAAPDVAAVTAAVAPAPLQVTRASPNLPARLQPERPLILIIEDDPAFAEVVANMTRRRGCEAMILADGYSGLAAAVQYKPTGIILDVGLPGMDGWTVIEHLKNNPLTARIPVHFISGDDQTGRGLDLGAVGFLVKPVSEDAIQSAFDKMLGERPEKATHRLLLVDPDPASRTQIQATVAKPGLELVEASTGREALAQLTQGGFDGLILDMSLTDMNGLDLLEVAAAKSPLPPVVVYSSKDLDPQEATRLRQITDSVVFKSTRSPERLLDEVNLFLHSVETKQPAIKPPMVDIHSDLAGKTVLIVDDDMRNVFALSRAVRARGLNVLMAEDGTRALAQLESAANIDIVLMDIMMPGMDGYETMRRIRQRSVWRDLPIIAVSAKAMLGDREKCLEAGANDYLSKPIDMDKLASMMRVLLQP